MKKVAYLLAILAIFTFSLLWGKTFDGIQFPDELNLHGKTAKLVGIGLRQKTIFKVNVYYGALYMEVPSKSSAVVITANQAKQIRMKFARTVDASTIQESTKAAMIKNSTEAERKNLQVSIDALMRLLPKINKGDILSLSYNPADKALEVLINDRLLGKIPGYAFMRIIYSCYFGIPSDSGLKAWKEQVLK